MSVNDLLDFIAQPESEGDPNAIWGRIDKADRPKQPVTSMTFGEVLAWQDSIDHKYMSEAVGKWQFLEDTLRGAYLGAGLKQTDRFSEENQRRVALVLLRRRGLNDYLRGEIPAVRFAQNISKEWASMPCTIKDRRGRRPRGQSYYAGDGLNKAHVSISALMKAVHDAKSEPKPPVADHVVEKVDSPSLFSAILKIFATIFGGKK
jgi:hypothetical protein